MEVQQETVKAQSHPLTRFITNWFLNGLVGAAVGCGSGAIAGTFIFPIIGTIYGGFLGMVGGGAGGLILGPFTATALLVSNSVQEALRLVTWIGIVGVVIIEATACAMTAFDGIIGIAIALAIPATTGAAYSGAYVLRTNVSEETAASIEKGVYGFRFTLVHVAAASVIGALVVWLPLGVHTI